MSKTNSSANTWVSIGRLCLLVCVVMAVSCRPCPLIRLNMFEGTNTGDGAAEDQGKVTIVWSRVNHADYTTRRADKRRGGGRS